VGGYAETAYEANLPIHSLDVGIAQSAHNVLLELVATIPCGDIDERVSSLNHPHYSLVSEDVVFDKLIGRPGIPAALELVSRRSGRNEPPDSGWRFDASSVEAAIWLADLEVEGEAFAWDAAVNGNRDEKRTTEFDKCGRI
jgi:hypothetical protein